MPYSDPSPAVLPAFTAPHHSMGRPSHRRGIASFSNERGPGAFAPIGSLPRRTTPAAKFHFRADEDDSSSSDSSARPPAHDPRHYDDDDDEHDYPPPLKIKQSPFRLSLKTAANDTALLSVPFPRGSPSPRTPSPPPSFSRPSPSRTNSSPILLSNGKPLKSSLKSSSSSPNVSSHAPTPPPSHLHHHSQHHLRARSEPSTPTPDLLTPKNVHFSTTDLATVRVFNRSAKPASLLGDETETETEGEREPVAGFPFPSTPSSNYVLDLKHYPIPCVAPPLANIHLESLSLSAENLTLTGTIVVKNVSFEKHVFIRFTLDNWQTTSEVSAKYEESLDSLPVALAPKTVGDLVLVKEKENWDRFKFVVRLEDYAGGLGGKVMWMVARYYAPGVGEWWDNNHHRDYRVEFKKVSAHARTVSAPASSGSSTPPLQNLPRLHIHTPSPLHTPIPPPPSKTSPTAAAVTNRLSKLSLKNYAAPSLTTPKGSVGLHWPWGHSTTKTPSPLKPPSPSKEHNQYPFPTLPASPLPVPSADDVPMLERSASGSTYEESEVGDLRVELERARLDSTSSTSSSESSSSLSDVDLPVEVKPTVNLYDAFVKKWCFAQGQQGVQV